MTIYFINLLFLLAVYYIVGRLKINKKWFLRISFFYLFIISSFRNNNIGTDYHSYITAFEVISDTGTYYMEKGFVLLNRIIALFTSSHVGVSIAVNLMLMIPLYKYITECMEENTWGLAMAIFALNPYMFIESTFNILRQSCATGLMMIGMSFLLKEKSAKNVLIYFLLTIVAAKFHRISYIMLIIPFVVYFPWNKITWLFALFMSLLLNLTNTSSIQAIIIEKLRFRPTYSTYEASPLNNPVYIACIVVVFIYFLSRYNDYQGETREQKNKIDLYLFSICFLIIAISNDMIYRVYIILSYLALPGISVIMNSQYRHTARVYLKKELLVVKGVYILYYMVFYFGYLVLLVMDHNINYIPFRMIF